MRFAEFCARHMPAPGTIAYKAACAAVVVVTVAVSMACAVLSW